MGTLIDLTGKTFSRLLVVGQAGRNSKQKILWRCKCECGQEVTVIGENLKNGVTHSCGCLKREWMDNFGQRNKTHGQAAFDSGKRTSTYRVWMHMRDRCRNTNNKDYRHYGGRGITVCDEWGSFERFYIDVGDKPEDMSIDRIDNEKGYYKENCRWATKIQQANNKRTNKKKSAQPTFFVFGGG